MEAKFYILHRNSTFVSNLNTVISELERTHSLQAPFWLKSPPSQRCMNILSQRRKKSKRHIAMTSIDEPEAARSDLTAQAQTYKSYNDSGQRVADICSKLSERSPLMMTGSQQIRTNTFFQLSHLSERWMPRSDEEKPSSKVRSWKRRFFLLLTEPESSFGSAVFYFVLIFAIFASNIIMIMQTMKAWQFTPTDCHSCGG